MKRDNKLLKFTAFILLITLVALILVSGTYAKYTSSASGFDTATVAKWSIQVSGTEIAVKGTAPTVEFNLFNTIKDTGSTANETDVATDKIAPGTEGAFDLIIKNASEVNAKYSIDFTISDNTVPLQFSIDGTTWTDDITSVVEDAIDMGATETVTVQWKWVYEVKDGNNVVNTAVDTADTALGITPQTITVTADIDVVQVD